MISSIHQEDVVQSRNKMKKYDTFTKHPILIAGGCSLCSALVPCLIGFTENQDSIFFPSAMDLISIVTDPEKVKTKIYF